MELQHVHALIQALLQHPPRSLSSSLTVDERGIAMIAIPKEQLVADHQRIINNIPEFLNSSHVIAADGNHAELYNITTIAASRARMQLIRVGMSGMSGMHPPPDSQLPKCVMLIILLTAPNESVVIPMVLPAPHPLNASRRSGTWTPFPDQFTDAPPATTTQNTETVSDQRMGPPFIVNCAGSCARALVAPRGREPYWMLPQLTHVWFCQDCGSSAGAPEQFVLDLCPLTWVQNSLADVNLTHVSMWGAREVLAVLSNAFGVLQTGR
jgi:hypothetical protein